MASLFDVPVDAAYHLVSFFAAGLTPVFGGFAAVAAIIGFTMAIRLLLLPLSYRALRGLASQTRIAPAVAALREKHAGRPEVLQEELAALYRAEGTSMFAGCLPLLVQWPFLSVMYLLFRSPTIGGVPNALLHHDLFGVPLASHWLGSFALLGVHGLVFAGLLAVLAALCWLTTRVARGLTAQAGTGTEASDSGVSGPGASGTGASLLAGSGVVGQLMPYVTVVFAAFLPLAAGIYLVTTTAWTLGERALLGRQLQRKEHARLAPA